MDLTLREIRLAILRLLDRCAPSKSRVPNFSVQDKMITAALRALQICYKGHTDPNRRISQRQFKEAFSKAVDTIDWQGEEPFKKQEEVRNAIECAIIKISQLASTKNEKLGFAVGVLGALHNTQPILSYRNRKIHELQQHSTPLTVAWFVNWFLSPHMKRNANVIDPMAGTGMLCCGFADYQVIVNDIDPVRYGYLSRTQVYNNYKKVHNLDAIADYRKIAGRLKIGVALINPLCGSLKKPVEFDGLLVQRKEHLIGLQTLSLLEDDGVAAVILLRSTQYDEQGEVAGIDGEFIRYLYSHYNVLHQFEFHDDLYPEHGEQSPFRLLFIHGRELSDRTPPRKGDNPHPTLSASNHLEYLRGFSLDLIIGPIVKNLTARIDEMERAMRTSKQPIGKLLG